MTDLDLKIAELEHRLDKLMRTQIGFQTEVSAIRRELANLRSADKDRAEPLKASPPVTQPQNSPAILANEPEEPSVVWTIQDPPPRRPVEDRAPSFGMPHSSDNKGSEAHESAFSRVVNSYSESARTDLEKFIGENLISKIGIAVLVLGVGIGVKYAIDNGWVSPLMRMIFGYVMGFGLLGVAAKLKSKYHDFSAVLVSGGMAILYFVTYFGYAYYDLIPQAAAFPLMAMFTAFTVAAALLYDRQVIAHIGLVGAYAVPFLLSNNSGNYLFLFIYMTIVNAGILAISIKRYWRPLFYTSSGFTWLIFLGWLTTKYTFAEHFYLALVFLAIFFVGFYAAKVIQGLVHADGDDAENIIAIVGTGFIFYSFLFAIANVHAASHYYIVLFTYLAISSLAILLTSYHFYGRVFVYLSYPFTWLIFGVWFTTKYNAGEHLVIAIVFASVFFAIYYGATLIYRLVTEEINAVENAGLVLTNSFVFYGLGYAILDSREPMQSFQGIYTAGHAALHLFVAHAVNKLRSAAVDVVQVLTVLVLIFSTIAIPIQFDGNSVTLIWTVQAAVLFWFGRARIIPLFELFSLPLMALACFSLLLDWVISHADRTMTVSEHNLQVFANGDFIAAAVFVIAFSFIYVVNRDKSDQAAIPTEQLRPLGIAAATAAILVLYNMFRLEIDNYFHLRTVSMVSLSDPLSSDPSRVALGQLNTIWQINYSMLFLALMGLVNIRKARSEIVAHLNAVVGIIALFIFATLGMQMFYELREGYLLHGTGSISVVIRWLSYIFAASLMFTLFKYRDDPILAGISEDRRKFGFDAVLYMTLFITASCELLNLMAQFDISDGSKLGLSILWGVYALFLIVLGIKGSKKHLRIAAIGLLAVTLVKLFLFDIADLETIPKTILFVSLGLLMLIVSFLYNKYKYFIFKPETEGST